MLKANELVVPGYVTGRWAIDPSHSHVGFSVRHMMVTKVQGSFKDVEGEVVTGEEPLSSRVKASISTASIDTGNSDRDNQVRSADFLDVERFPTMSYVSTGLVMNDGLRLDGELTLKGVTRPLSLSLEIYGIQSHPQMGTRLGLSASGELKRSDFGVDFNVLLDAGGVLIADKVGLQLEIQAVLQQPEKQPDDAA